MASPHFYRIRKPIAAQIRHMYIYNRLSNSAPNSGDSIIRLSHPSLDFRSRKRDLADLTISSFMSTTLLLFPCRYTSRMQGIISSFHGPERNLFLSFSLAIWQSPSMPNLCAAIYV